MSAIDRFVAALAAEPPAAGLFNPYARDGGPAAAACRYNLHRYMTTMQQRDPPWLLVGEAPGYRGCRLTGIPFTSEAVLWPREEGSDGFGLWGDAACWRRSRKGGRPQAEATATIVWRTVGALEVLPLLWNALPFHPHRLDRPDSNRTPSREELSLGRPYLLALLALFPAARPVAVGQKAAGALARWGINALEVRHPSHGGAHRFAAQLAQVVGSEAGKDQGSSELK